IEKDHKELEELMQVFETFKNNSKLFIVNQSNEHSRKLSTKLVNDFEIEGENRGAGFFATGFRQKGFSISFDIENQHFELNLAGRHNMENALAAVTVAVQTGVNLTTASEALKLYEGIYRRCQVLGNK